MATLVVYADTTDGWVRSFSTTYATARSGGTLFASNASSTLLIGQSLATEYYCWETFVQWDTSALDDAAIIDVALLEMWLTDDSSATDFTVEARLYDWGTDLTTADWIAGASLSGNTRLATRATSGIGATGAYKSFTSDAAFISNISKTGSTRLMLHSDRQSGNNTPTGSENVQFSAADVAGTTQDPKLTITYTVTQTISSAGAIASAEAPGVPTVAPGSVSISPSSIASAEAFGTAVLAPSITVSPSAIASTEAFGTAVIAPGSVSITGAGAIASAEAFGTPALAPGSVTITGVGAIASAEAFGTLALALSITVSPSGIASAEAFGTAAILLVQAVLPSGIASAEAFGTATVAPGAVTISVSGIASAEAFGTATLNQLLTMAGIASAEAFGTPLLSISISPSAIASAEAFGTPTLTLGPVTVSPSGIASLEAFGTAQLNQLLTMIAIASEEAFGTPVVAPGAVTLLPSGIASLEAFGSPTLHQLLTMSGIASAEAFGTPRLALRLLMSGIASEEAFGTARLNQLLTMSGIASAEAFGTAVLRLAIRPSGIATAEAFGTAVVWAIYRYRRLKAIQYHALLYGADSNGGPGVVKAELDPHLLNLVWSQSLNQPGQAAFALARRNPIFDQIEWMVDHIKIFRDSTNGIRTVFAGKLVAPQLSGIDVFVHAWDYAALLQLSVTGYKTMYPSKLVGSEIIAPEWALAKGVANSPFSFVSTGTIQDPLGLDGTTPIRTNATFGVVLFDRLFTFSTIAEMAMANTDNNVKFEITRDTPHTFNFWKNYGTNKTDFVASFPGNLASHDFDGGKESQRLELFTVLSDGAGGQVAHSVTTADVATSALRRLQGAIPIRTLFGTTAGATETDQAKAALQRQLKVSTRYPRFVRVTPRQGDFDIFNGNDLGDRFRHVIQRPDEAGDFYDGYLLWHGVIGAWSPQHGELIDLYQRGHP